LYNLYPGFHNVSPWEEFLQRNKTPPYIDARPEVTHVPLDRQADNLRIDGHTGVERISREKSGPAPGPRFLVLSSDGFADLCSGDGHERIIKTWAESVAKTPAATGSGPVLPSENLAVQLLRCALGGEDLYSVSRVLTLDMDVSWIDDTSIVVQTL
jgi:pyruvate dehydrogenase phosphatase